MVYRRNKVQLQIVQLCYNTFEFQMASWNIQLENQAKTRISNWNIPAKTISKKLKLNLKFQVELATWFVHFQSKI